MTKNEVKNLLNTLNDDIMVFEHEDTIRVTVCDFEGFDADWNEVMKDYDVDKVNEVIDALVDNANEVVSNLYTYISFDGFTVVVGYESFDI